DQQSDLRTILSSLLTLERKSLILADGEEVFLSDIMVGIERAQERIATLEQEIGRLKGGGNNSGGSGGFSSSAIEEVD
ncbi:9712_t:CDS:1, partial [Ambispora gerdemannii]